jgi:hypothetical protein
VEALKATYHGDINQFAQISMQKEQHRDDYQEFLEYAILVPGGAPVCGVNFQTTGAIHHTRWMAKVIYVCQRNVALSWTVCGMYS